MTTTDHLAAPTADRPVIAERKLFIGGRWVDAIDGARTEILDPATTEVVTTVAEAGAADVDAAVRAARAAAPAWAALPARERGRILHRVSLLMRERADELVATESIDVGKPVSLCLPVDVTTSADQYEYYAGLAQAIEGSTRSTGFPALAYTIREPLGVVAAITPFNFPLILSSSKLAPALAAGNTVVHKPADIAPLSALLMGEIFAEAGLPDGVVNIVSGLGPVAGDALLNHPDIDKIAFTGSTTVGRHAAAVAGEALVPITLELGGNAAQIIFEDADLDKAIGSAIKAFVFNTGQFCMAGPRLLVHSSLYETVLGILSQAVPGVPLGDPFDPATVIGPLAGEQHRAKAEGFIAQARAEGARIVTGGGRPELPGYFLEPTVIADLPNDSRVVQDEVFGPILTVQPFETEEQAIAMANSTAYGLASGLVTENLARAHRVAAQLQAGIVWVNDWAMLDPTMPFGGVKSSGHGREYGPEALDSYTRTKSVLVSLA